MRRRKKKKIEEKIKRTSRLRRRKQGKGRKVANCWREEKIMKSKQKERNKA